MKRIELLPLVVVTALAVVGCEKVRDLQARAKAPAQEEENTVPPEERKYLAEARPFIDAIVARNYEQAFGLLSSHAKSRLSPNQFVPAEDDAQFRRGEANAVMNATLADFTAFMGKVERWHGQPHALKHSYVQSIDQAVLSGGGDKLDAMFSIGNMPSSIPTHIRRASVRCQVGVKLSAAKMQQIAQAHGVSVAELEKDTDFSPYFNLKLVLVEEEGALRVGYFEFLSPSMFD
jgi:hypothetical protein